METIKFSVVPFFTSRIQFGSTGSDNYQLQIIGTVARREYKTWFCRMPSGHQITSWSD